MDHISDADLLLEFISKPTMEDWENISGKIKLILFFSL
jgi:hypothetical protein